MKSNNRKKTAELGSGALDTTERSGGEPRDKVEDAVRVPHTESVADTQELPGTADPQSFGTPSPRSPRRDEHGIVQKPAARVLRESDDEDDDDEQDEKQDGNDDEEEDDDDEQDEDDEQEEDDEEEDEEDGDEDDDEEDGDEDDDEEDGDEDDDELDEIVMEFEESYGVAYSEANYNLDDTEEDPAPTTVPDDDPELLALLRSMDGWCEAGRALAGYLEKHNDPRTPAVRALTTARLVFPATSGELPEQFTVLATDQWHVTAKRRGWDADGRIVITVLATAYCGTDLSKGMVNYGDHERFQGMQLTYKVYRGDWDRDSISAAFDCLRLRLVSRLFHTTPEEVNCPPDELVARRAQRYVELLRKPYTYSADYVCEMIQDAPPLQEALLAALSQQKADRLIWHGLMDHLNPGWQSRVVFKPATSPPETRPA